MASSGAFSGRTGGSASQWLRRRVSCGNTPALSSDDLPEPDDPITTMRRAPPCVRRASSRSIKVRVSSSRPK
jgi:hypothetical protein